MAYLLNYPLAGAKTPESEETPVAPFTGPTPNADMLRNHLTTLRISEKPTQQLSSGGDIELITAKMGIKVSSLIKQSFPNIRMQFTGGNDLYHQQITGYSSRHKRAQALDFTVKNSSGGALPYTYINQVEDILQKVAVANNPNFRYINEYLNPTKKATGKHFHISWGFGTEGQTELDAANKKYKNLSNISNYSIS